MKYKKCINVWAGRAGGRAVVSQKFGQLRFFWAERDKNNFKEVRVLNSHEPVVA